MSDVRKKNRSHKQIKYLLLKIHNNNVCSFFCSFIYLFIYLLGTFCDLLHNMHYIAEYWPIFIFQWRSWIKPRLPKPTFPNCANSMPANLPPKTFTSLSHRYARKSLWVTPMLRKLTISPDLINSLNNSSSKFTIIMFVRSFVRLFIYLFIRHLLWLTA